MPMALAVAAAMAPSSVRSLPCAPMSRVAPTKFRLSRFSAAAVLFKGHSGSAAYAALPSKPCSSAATHRKICVRFAGFFTASCAMASKPAVPEALSTAPL
ncbi:hypothetical protein D3C81_1824180 [compost metagenome]